MQNLRVAILMLALIGGIFPRAASEAALSAYVEPAVVAGQSGILALIVAGESSAQAAAAVERLGGQVTSDLWLIGAVGARIPATALDALARYPGIRALTVNRGIRTAESSEPDGSDEEGWITDYRFPVPWDGTPDVQPGRTRNHIKLAYPVTVDIGADVLYNGWISRPIRGDGVGIAVMDSGVYFSDYVKKIYGAHAANRFRGQADFVGSGECTEFGTGKLKGAVVQADGYCWSDYRMSKDPYGHGTHVTGIVINEMNEQYTGTRVGVAPEAKILSVRILDESGQGTYEDAIEGIQFVVANRNTFGIRVMNLSLSANATVPYFVDPLNRAVESAWAAGIVVVAAAGNTGPQAETITVPGSDPYVITVGAINSRRTAGYWTDDRLPTWSATGPTLDGFIKPDLLAPGAHLVSFMYNGGLDSSDTAQLVKSYPDYSHTADFFRMNGTSMATAVVSGVVAMMLEAHPELTPDQVKFRLLYSARPAIDEDDIAYSLLQQGAGRVWAPDAVLGSFPADGKANVGMDIQSDLSHGYASESEMAYHYQGPLRKQTSDDGASILYYAATVDEKIYGFGSVDAITHEWLSLDTLNSHLPTWSGSYGAWGDGAGIWAGGYSHPAGLPTWSGGLPTWSGGLPTWSGGLPTWSGGLPTWSGGMIFAGSPSAWSGGLPTWSGGLPTWSGGLPTWSGGLSWAGALPTWSGGLDVSVSATRWVGDTADDLAASAASVRPLEMGPGGNEGIQWPVLLFLPAVRSGK